MRKMPCLFVREFHGRNFTITNAVTPGCEWVLNGEGQAYRKRDGTACAVIGGKLYRRYDAKRSKTPPEGAIPCDVPDEVTGHWPHWIEVTEVDKQAKWHWAAWERSRPLPDGTYELCGPHFQANPEGFTEDSFMSHTAEDCYPERTFDGLRDMLGQANAEGVVFHHPDGRMAKIRRHDFGFPWGHR